MSAELGQEPSLRAEDLELAAEFCKIVGTPDLLVYLGLDENADSATARNKLKERRKFMQGMQSNPKYKREALFLIKNFASLNETLADVPEYLGDARRRAESEHLPVIEMTVRGVLAGGSLTDDQLAYLRHNALELGVSEATFQELLKRVGAELGMSFEGTSEPTPALDGPPLDLYQLLGIPPTANEDDVRVAYHRRLEELDTIADPNEQDMMRRRIEIARKVLENEAARRHYDLTAARTGPPARSREFRPDHQAPTAPPSQSRTVGWAGARPGGTPRLEILGDPVRTIRPGQTVTITIRNGGDGPMHGWVTPDVGWLRVQPTRLDPNAPEQNITVQLLAPEPPKPKDPPKPKEPPKSAVLDSGSSETTEEAAKTEETAQPVDQPMPTTASVTIETERGEKARVVFEIRRGPPPWVWAALAGVAVLVLVVVLALWLT